MLVTNTHCRNSSASMASTAFREGVLVLLDIVPTRGNVYNYERTHPDHDIIPLARTPHYLLYYSIKSLWVREQLQSANIHTTSQEEM